MLPVVFLTLSGNQGKNDKRRPTSCQNTDVGQNELNMYAAIWRLTVFFFFRLFLSGVATADFILVTTTELNILISIILSNNRCYLRFRIAIFIFLFSLYKQGFNLRFIFVSMQIFPIRSFFIYAGICASYRPIYFAFKCTMHKQKHSLEMLKVWSLAPHWIGCIQGGTATGETDTMLAFLNTPTFPVFSPPTNVNPAFILRFYFSFILLLSTVLLFTNIPRNAY